MLQPLTLGRIIRMLLLRPLLRQELRKGARVVLADAVQMFRQVFVRNAVAFAPVRPAHVVKIRLMSHGTLAQFADAENIANAKSHVLQAPSMFFWRVLSSCGSAECRGVEETGASPAVKCCIQLKCRRIENRGVQSTWRSVWRGRRAEHQLF